METSYWCALHKCYIVHVAVSHNECPKGNQKCIDEWKVDKPND